MTLEVIHKFGGRWDYHSCQKKKKKKISVNPYLSIYLFRLKPPKSITIEQVHSRRDKSIQVVSQVKLSMEVIVLQTRKLIKLTL